MKLRRGLSRRHALLVLVPALALGAGISAIAATAGAQAPATSAVTPLACPGKGVVAGVAITCSGGASGQVQAGIVHRDLAARNILLLSVDVVLKPQSPAKLQSADGLVAQDGTGAGTVTFAGPSAAATPVSATVTLTAVPLPTPAAAAPGIERIIGASARLAPPAASATVSGAARVSWAVQVTPPPSAS